MIKETAYAKINIGLDIVEKRPDGYHNIDTIMQAVSLSDELYLEKAPGITIKCSDSIIPTNQSNTVYLAASLFFNKAGIDYQKNGVSVNLVKHIPSQAGLGGGSSDAAAMLRALNKLYCTNFSTASLR
ncbi:MAG: 4-(cytidine 5'-diphospho)-2-C-methyl-D-erythritol kinase, partial [Clostridiales bacterium]|nr:4-(cytidine 5'-diphospho)-2-C-methyl-D-erythritol kinase [Clostridiales bacterium]